MEEWYESNDVCIVGKGCVLPGASCPEEFWENVSSGICSIKKMPKERFDANLYLSNDRSAEDKAYSSYAGFVDDQELEKISYRLGEIFSRNKRLNIMSLEATRQALNCLKNDTNKKAKQVSFFLGCMELGDGFSFENFFAFNKELLKKYLEKNIPQRSLYILKKMQKYFNREIDENGAIGSILTTSVIDILKKKFHLKGKGNIIDAACASSLAALEGAVDALKNYETDLALVGGIESNLRPDSFVLFSKVGVLSKGICFPFDHRTDGLSQGEGAVMFVLQRMEDALCDGNTIYGVIRSIGSSSDGKSASLFSPSIGGQILAYERAYQNVDPRGIDYIECHGTGTKIGDMTEIESLNSFFEQRVPIGSVKSLVGHTKGSAGAVGLLKCLFLLEKKCIPPSRYIQSPLTPHDGKVYVNTRTISLKKKSEKKTLQCGISSFGFGNINYHVVLEEWKKDRKVQKKVRDSKEKELVIIGKGHASLRSIHFDILSKKFHIPLRSMASIDTIQLLALSAVEDAFEKSHINIHSLDKERISVFSASILGLESSLKFFSRIFSAEFEKIFDNSEKDIYNFLKGYKGIFPKVTEDTGPGILNNVIAGRICNVFDFRGKNLNVDADFNSFSVAMNFVKTNLLKNDGIAVLVFCKEKLNVRRRYTMKGDVSCLLLTTLDYAKQKSYPIKETVESIDYEE